MKQAGFGLISILIIIPIILLSIGSGYYIKSTFSNDNELINKDKEITNLSEKITSLEEVIEKADKPKKEIVAEKEIELPVVVYIPGGLFEKEEKNELKEKLIEPFIDFNLENDQEFVSVAITKLKDGDFLYDIEAIAKKGGHAGFLFGLNGKIAWWVPDCLDGCELSENFSNKYPKIAKLVN